MCGAQTVSRCSRMHSRCCCWRSALPAAASAYSPLRHPHRALSTRTSAASQSTSVSSFSSDSAVPTASTIAMLCLQFMFKDWRPGVAPPESSRALWLSPFCTAAASPAPSPAPSPLQSVFSAALARYRREQEDQEEPQHSHAPRQFLALETQPEGALATVSSTADEQQLSEQMVC
jgi:hypothetical protein